MWLSTLWKPRNRFSLDELRYLTDQLMKVQIVNEVNKAFVIESLRSIAELMTYGDQHDPAFFEFFMEKQIMGEFVRILKMSRTVIVSLQLLQTMSIMIQNLKNEHSIYYMFSNEHINCLITYPFDFRNEELLSYYISFLRAISGKLNKNTISLLVKTQKDEVVAFPLYVEAIRFAFNEEGMIRTAVRALTLNIYHVGDEAVNKYVASAPHADYFLNLVKFFRDQCINLDGLVSRASENLGPESISFVLSDVDEIEDNLYYFSDVISAGIPDVGRLITDNILKLLIFPLILPSLRMTKTNEEEISAATSLYLICCLLRIVKLKDLANTVAAALLCRTENFVPRPEVKTNGHADNHGFVHESEEVDKDCTAQDSLPDVSSSSQSQFESNHGLVHESEEVEKDRTVPDLLPDVSSSSQDQSESNLPQQECTGSLVFREALLSYITSGDDILVSGSLNVLATLLQTKELDESMLDALGILPQRKQQKKLLLQALVGEGSGEEQLFSSETNVTKNSCSCELDNYLEKLKDQYRLLCTSTEVGTSPRLSRFQVLDALVSLFGRSNISAETLWDGGWLLRQLLPYSEAEFNSHHLKLIKDSFQKCARRILEEARGMWLDQLIAVLCDEWRKCKRAIEASSPRKDPRCILLPTQNPFSEDLIASESSSYIAGARMSEMVKVFVLLHQLHFFSLGRALLDQPPVEPPIDVPDKSRAKVAGLDVLGPKSSNEIFLVDAVPCRIAFERGKERHFCFLASSVGTSGWVILAEELSVKPQHGVIRIVAPLAGCNPKIDEKHSRWLHLRIRPSSFPITDTAKYAVHGKVKTKALVDGRWTLAFRDEETCKTAFSMILEEINRQRTEVERRLQPLLDLERTVDSPRPTQPQETAFSRTRLNIV